MKKLVVILVVLASLSLTTCDLFVDGTITITVTGFPAANNGRILASVADSNANLVAASADFYDGLIVAGTGSAVMQSAPGYSADFIATGGNTYFVSVFIDGNDDGTINQNGVDYWHNDIPGSPIPIIISGDTTINLTAADFYQY